MGVHTGVPRAAVRLVLGTLLALAIGVLGGCGGSSGDQPKTDAAGVKGIKETTALLEGVPQQGLVLGDPKAPVTLVEIVDLQCPFCRKHELEVQPKVVKELVRTGRVQLHLVPVAFLGADSQRMEVVFLRLAKRNQAFQFANLVFANQQREGTGYATDDWIRRIVAAIPGTQPELASTTPDQDIARTAQVANAVAQTSVRRAGGGGTPFFTVGPSTTALAALTPILTGAPPNSYATILAAVEAVEAGKAPKELKVGAPAGIPPATAKGA